MSYDKEYFEKWLHQTYKDSVIKYKGELDGKLVFHIGVKAKTFVFTGPPIYAFCDPNDPSQFEIRQGFDILNRLEEQEE